MLAIKRDPSFHLKCPSLASDIVARRFTLVGLVENLKDLLTDPEPSQRAVGLGVLSSVLQELPVDFLREDELQFVVTFFCDRLKDHHDVVPAALRGIRSILRMTGLTAEQPVQILRSIMLNITCQSSPQEDRLIIYQILDLLILPHLESLKVLGPDLVYHVITTIDGERDPRNLQYLFTMLPAMVKGLTLGHLAEDFFEAMACYFPVDYRAPNDEEEITRIGLAHALADCLTAVPEFTDYCINLILEKIDTPLRVAKNDSLHLLSKAYQAFPAANIAVHLSSLWMTLSREALSGPDFEVREGARQCVTQLLRCLANLPLLNGHQSQPMRQLLGDVVSASISSLSGVHTSLFVPATELLLAAAKSCAVASEHILVKVMPQVVDICSEIKSQTDQSIYLRVVSKFLDVCISQNVTPENTPSVSVQWNLLVQLFFVSSNHEGNLLRKEAIHGLTTVVPTLSSSERQTLYNLICSRIDEEYSPDIREEVLQCLFACAVHYTAEVEQTIVKDKLSLQDFNGTDPQFARRLEAHCCVAAVDPIGGVVFSFLVKLITTSADPVVIHTTFVSLRKLLKTSADKSPYVYKCLRQCDFLNQILLWWVNCVSSVQECEWVKDEEVIDQVCFVVSAIVRNMTPELQGEAVHRTVSLFFPGSNQFRPCEVSSPVHHNLAVALLEAALAPLHPDVQVPDVHKLCNALVKLAISCRYPSAVISANRLCANLINKHPNAILLDTMVLSIYETLKAAHAETSPEHDAVQAVAMYGWIIRGLAMRGYSNLEIWINGLTELLEDNRQGVAMSAAGAFESMMKESAQSLDSENYCTSRLFYKQRIFESGLKLVSKARLKPSGDRTPYLYALAYLLKDVPANALVSKFGEVAPLLIETLSQTSTALLELALSTIGGLLHKSAYSNMLTDYVQTLVPRLLQLANFEHSMQVRRTALDCLSEISKFPTHLLLPFKDEVICKLSACLDDKKRLVRKDAVKARSCWLAVGVA